MIRLLHISDLHYQYSDNEQNTVHAFGRPRQKRDKKSTAKPGIGLLTLADAISEAIPDELRNIDGLVVSGDFTNFANHYEFTYASWDLDFLCKKLSIEKKNVILIPGNHDLNWAHDKEERFSEFSTMFKLFSGTDPSDDLTQDIIIQGDKEIIRLLGVNSASIESKEDGGMGFVDFTVLVSLLKQAKPRKKLDVEKPLVTVLCLHHHLLPVNFVEREYFDGKKRTSITLDAKAILLTCLENKISLVLHGHQHQPSLIRHSYVIPTEENKTNMPSLWVSGAGSAGVKQQHLGFPNRHFQILEFNGLNNAVVCGITAFTSHPINEHSFVKGQTVSIDLQHSTPINQLAVAGSVSSPERTKEKFLQGVRLVQQPIMEAFGPFGTGFYTQRTGTQHIPEKCGYTISCNLRSQDPYEEQGIIQMRVAAQKVYNSIGDTTKTTMLLASSMAEQGYGALRDDFFISDVIQGMQKAVSEAVQFIKKEAKPLTTNQDNQLLNTAITATLGDASLGSLIMEAVTYAGEAGVFVREGINNSPISLYDGMWLNTGYISEAFITESDTPTCVLENCFVLVYDRDIDTLVQIHPLLEKLEKVTCQGKSLLIIAKNVDYHALNTLIVNKARGTLRVAAVGATTSRFTGRLDIDRLEDIVAFTGGISLYKLLSISVEHFQLDWLGQANRVVISNNCTVITRGNGLQEEIAKRAEKIKADILIAKDNYEKRRNELRLANLTGRVAIIHPSGNIPAESNQQEYKAESAINAVRAVTEGGWLPGGGIIFLRAKKVIEKLSYRNEAELAGIKVVSRALEEPTRALIKSTRGSVTDLLPRIENGLLNTPMLGFNVKTRELEDMVKAGIVDPAKALYTALDIGFSAARAILENGAI